MIFLYVYPLELYWRMPSTIYNFIYIQLQGGKSVTERGKKASVRSAGTGGHGCRNDNSIKVNNPRKVKKRYI